MTEGLAGKRVLISGRQPQTNDYLRRLLATANLRIETTGEPASALSAAAAAAEARDPLQLLLLDGDGLADGDLELYQRVGQIFGAPAIPVMVVGGPTRRDAGVIQAAAGDDAGLARMINQVFENQVVGGLAAVETVALPALAVGNDQTDDKKTDRKMRILLAEDNEVNQMVAMGMLSSLGYAADVVPNGAEAVAAMERTPYDLVLMDVRMPVMDGLEATRRIRALAEPAGRTPIVAVTANAMRGDEESCLDAGMNDYLPKPIRLATLDAAIKRWMPDDK